MSIANHSDGRAVRGAFTLIELLVVVAIIALLVAILIPTLDKARESAKRVVCMTNMHSLWMASLLYADQQEGYPPHALGYEYLLWSEHGPWGGLFDTGIFPDAEVEADRSKPGVADNMYCPSQRDLGYMQGTPENLNNRCAYQARYHYAPWASDLNKDYRVRKVKEIPTGRAVVADVFMYATLTHLSEGINVARVDASVYWFEFPSGIHPMVEFWSAYFTRQDVADYWAGYINPE